MAKQLLVIDGKDVQEGDVIKRFDWMSNIEAGRVVRGSGWGCTPPGWPPVSQIVRDKTGAATQCKPFGSLKEWALEVEREVDERVKHVSKCGEFVVVHILDVPADKPRSLYSGLTTTIKDEAIDVTALKKGNYAARGSVCGTEREHDSYCWVRKADLQPVVRTGVDPSERLMPLPKIEPSAEDLQSAERIGVGPTTLAATKRDAREDAAQLFRKDHPQAAEQASEAWSRALAARQAQAREEERRKSPSVLCELDVWE